MKRFAILLVAGSAAALAACHGDIGGDAMPSGGAGGGTYGTASGPACSPNDAVMKALAPTCGSCHAQGNAPFFATLSAFENLLVYEPKYVVAGKPDESLLVALLEGKASGTYKQMPLSGDTFAAESAAGKTAITLQQVKDWIAALTPRPKNEKPDPAAVTVQRLSAEQIVATLQSQLGLSQDDFFHPAAPITYGTLQRSTLGEDNYPVYSTDEAPGPFDVAPTQRHAALGGAQALMTKKRDQAASPPFAEALIPIAQRWCKMAIAKPQNKLLFPYVDPSAKSAASAADIQKNIGYLALHFLGEPADKAAIQDVFQSVFVPLEAASDPPTAWAGVCSYFVRHPKWIFF